MNKSELKPINVTILANAPKDRKELFEFLCQKLNLDPQKQADKLKIKSTASGFTVNVEHLSLFAYKNKLKGSFDYEENKFSVTITPLHAVGKVAIENPETIEATSVDKKPEADPKTEAVSPLVDASQHEDDDEEFDFMGDI